jgi:hypothetical protein
MKARFRKKAGFFFAHGSAQAAELFLKPRREFGPHTLQPA